MSTATIRIDDALRERIARVAEANEQTPHNFMVRALTEKVDEAEWTLALRDEAHQHGQRKLIISTGASGFLALYHYDPLQDAALLLAVRSQRERAYKR